MDDHNQVDNQTKQNKQEEDPYVLKMATCLAPNCKFSILSQNEDEIVEVVQGHARKFHDHEVSAEDVKKDLQTV